MKFVLLFFALILAPAYGFSDEGNNGSELSKDNEVNKLDATLDQPSEEAPSVEGQQMGEEEQAHQQKETIPMSLPKYTIMQIKEMKAKGIDPEALEEKITPPPQKPSSLAENKDEQEKSGKVIYRTAESACSHLRIGQICEYRKRNNSRWIGNCAPKVNMSYLYCK